MFGKSAKSARSTRPPRARSRDTGLEAEGYDSPALIKEDTPVSAPAKAADARRKGESRDRKRGRKRDQNAKVIPIRENMEDVSPPLPREPSRLIVSTPFDLPFFILVLVLLGFGLVMLFSASYVSALEYADSSTDYISSQVVSAAIGLVLLIVVSLFNYRAWRKYATVLLIIAVVLLVLVLFIGVVRNDARRWFNVFGMSFQPSELAKLAVITWFSAYISRNQDRLKTFKYGILPFVLVLGVVSFLLYKEPHMSAMIIIGFTAILLLFIGGVNFKYLFGAGIAGAAGMVAILLFTDYARARIDLWIDPYLDPRNKGYQIIQSLIAIGSGGWMGLGLGNSRQKHLYIPEPQNDFIFSIVVEELGFIGAVFILVLFAALIIRGYWIALHARDKFGSLMAAGITSIVALQAFLNMAVVTKLIPVTGVSLPFFSHGGSSLVILLIEMGIILAVSRQIPASDG